MASIFSKIVAGDIPCYEVASDERHLAFLDINPLVEGHTLVIPKREENYIFDLSPAELSDLMLFAQRVAASIKRSVPCERVAVVVLGLDVPHAHIHLIPLNKMEDVDFSREKLKLSPERFAQIATTLKGNM